MIHRLVDTMLRVTDALLKLVVPVHPMRVGYLSAPDYGDSAYYLYRHLLRTRHDLEHVWLVNDRTRIPAILADFNAEAANLRGHRLRVYAKKSLRGYIAYLGCRVMFYTHGLYRFSRWPYRREVFCLWHGMPIKCIGALDRRTPKRQFPFGTHHLASSHLFRYIVASAFAVPAETVKVLGLPRCDALSPGAMSPARRAEIRSRLGVRDQHTLILWLPTFRVSARRPERATSVPRSFFDDVSSETLAELDTAAQRADCEILVKLHPADVLNSVDPAHSFESIRILRSADWLALGIQLYDLAAVADGLMSDVSSILIDFLVTSRPIGILGYGEQSFTRDLTLPMELLLRSRHINRLDDIATIERFLAAARDPHANPDDGNDIAALFNEHPPGGSCERVAREVGL